MFIAEENAGRQTSRIGDSIRTYLQDSDDTLETPFPGSQHAAAASSASRTKKRRGKPRIGHKQTNQRADQAAKAAAAAGAVILGPTGASGFSIGCACGPEANSDLNMVIVAFAFIGVVTVI